MWQSLKQTACGPERAMGQSCHTDEIGFQNDRLYMPTKNYFVSLLIHVARSTSRSSEKPLHETKLTEQTRHKSPVLR